MFKTAKKDMTTKDLLGARALLDLMTGAWEDIAEAAIFNTMRILKAVNPGDAYYENYLDMKRRYPDFFDTYFLLWKIGATRPPKRILEIGTRTGISLCQLLSSMSREALDRIEKIVCVDPFDEWTSPGLVRANLKHLNLNAVGLHGENTIRIETMKSEEYFAHADSEHKDQFDYILVDGDHSKEAAKKDLDAAHELLEKGGLIIFDDISTAPGECALLDVWQAFKSEHEGEYAFNESLKGKGVGVGIKTA